MEIEYPEMKGGIPPQAEVEEIVLDLCKKCGYRHEDVVLRYVGGDRRRFFEGHGIKLVGYERHAVKMFIGGSKETVETFLQVKAQSGRAIFGDTIFNKLRTVLCGKIWRVPQVRKERVSPRDDTQNSSNQLATAGCPIGQQNGTNGTCGHHPVVDNPVSVEVESDPTHELLDQDEHPDPAEEVGKSVTDPIIYDRYFDDPANMHNAVFALVVGCNQSVNEPFNLNQMMAMLHKGDVPRDLSYLDIMICRIFMVREFVVRINPDRKPALFSITEKAIAFAEGPVPTGSVKTVKQNLSAKHHSVSPKLALADLHDTVLKLRKKVEEQTRIKGELESAVQEHTKLSTPPIEKDRQIVRVEIDSLEERLADLRRKLVNLDQCEKRIAQLGEKIEQLTKRLSDPSFFMAATELEKFRRLLG